MTALIHEALMSKKDDETSDSKIPKDLPDHKHFPKLKTHAIVKNMPAHLKDPANYDKIQKAILEAGATGILWAEDSQDLIGYLSQVDGEISVVIPTVAGHTED